MLYEADFQKYDKIAQLSADKNSHDPLHRRYAETK